jgi:hypothetical protein
MVAGMIFLLASSAGQAGESPNINYILADDLGVGAITDAAIETGPNALLCR